MNSIDKTLSVMVVISLDTIKNPDSDHVYMVQSNLNDNKIFEEYMYIDGKFEMIGSVDPNLTPEEEIEIEERIKEITTHNCPNCGANISYGQHKCDYCDSLLSWL